MTQAQSRFGPVHREACPRCGSFTPSIAGPSSSVPHYQCRHAWHMPERLTPRAQDAVDFTAAVDRLFAGDLDLPKSLLGYDPLRYGTAEYPQ